MCFVGLSHVILRSLFNLTKQHVFRMIFLLYYFYVIHYATYFNCRNLISLRYFLHGVGACEGSTIFGFSYYCNAFVYLPFDNRLHIISLTGLFRLHS